MSAKSRKRNRRLAALAGLAGAVALANRKPKQSDVSQDSGRGSGLRPTVDTAKKDTATKTSTTIQDNKNKDRTKSMAETSTVPKKRPGITVYDDGSIKAKDKGSGNQVNYANKEKYSTRTDTKPPGASGSTTSTGTTARGSSTFNDKIRANNERIRSGTSLKSGGRVKGCGKALRGYGKAMKGKR